MNKSILNKIIICLIMCSIILVGCSNGNNNGDNNNSSENNGQSATDDKIASTEREVKVMLKEHPSQPIKNMAAAQQEILKRTNIKLEFEPVPSSNYEDKKSVMLGTNNIPEIIEIGRQDIDDYASTKVFLPLMEYMEKGLMPNFKKHWDENPELQNLLVDGELYGFPALGRNESKNGSGPIIRYDLLEKHDLDMPSTFEELLEVLTELKALYPDSNPWTLRTGTKQLLATSAYMLGSGVGGRENPIYFDKDVDGGKYVFGPATPEFKEVLNYYARAYDAGVLDPDYAVMTSQRWEEKMTTGQSFFFIDNSGFGTNFTRTLQESDPDAKLQIMPIPENSFGQNRAVFFATDFTGTMYSVRSDVKDPEVIVEFMDWLYTEEASNLTNFGVEGAHYELDENNFPLFKEEFVEEFKDADPTPYYAIYTELGVGKLNFTPWFVNTESWFQVDRMTGNWDDINDEYWDIINNDSAYHDPAIMPPLTAEESKKVKDLIISIETMLDQEYDQFIIGRKSIDEYDKVIEKAREMGATEVEDIYNKALERAQE